ncbi:MAG TPA: L,D-transpeptidase, partial [Thermomicrobiales bacterium]|nr:L,D-transpeptidase [Thermomicrobiales bacterium]
GPNTDGTTFIQEDVPWVMYFYADFAIHGAYWRYSFGYSGSHGCVNLPVSDAAWLYAWAPIGTRVEVHY